MASQKAPRKTGAVPKAQRRSAAGQLIDAQKGMLQAGLRAVMGRSDPNEPGKSSWPLGSLEDVFDQRIAAALRRLGMPSATELAALTRRLEEAIERMDGLDKKRRQ
jgi:Poly(hydroxyalcanoate) granule associated protein (phasin)